MIAWAGRAEPRCALSDLDATAGQPEGSGEVYLCPHCLHPNPTEAHLCQACHVPILPLAFDPPTEVVGPRGWILGETAWNRAPNLLFVIMVWLLLSPAVGITVFLMATSSPRGTSGQWGIWAAGACSLLLLYVAVRATRNYVVRIRLEESAEDEE